METWLAVLISQIPLGIACIIAAYELHKFRNGYKDTQEKLLDVLDKLNNVLNSLGKKSK